MISLLGESNDNLLFHVLTANRLIHKSIYPSAKVTSVSSMQTLMHSLASSKTLIRTWSRWDRAAYIWSAILSMLEKKMKPTGMTYFYVIVSYLLINFLTQSVDDGFVLLFVIRERQNHCRYTGENDLDMECTPERGSNPKMPIYIWYSNKPFLILLRENLQDQLWPWFCKLICSWKIEYKC